MATKSKIAKQIRRKRRFLEALKVKTEQHPELKRVKVKGRIKLRNRCNKCGRPRGYIGFFQLCRICMREMADRGELPGVRKSSW